MKPLVQHPYIMTQASRNLLDYLSNSASSFQTRLFDLIFISDSTNLEKLRKVFPGEVAAVDAWRHDSEFGDWLRSKA